MRPSTLTRHAGQAVGKLLVLLIFASVAFAALAGWHARQAAQKSAQLSRKVTLLESDNERMRAELQRREKEQQEAQSRGRRAEIEREVENIRGLKFTHPVEYAVVTRREIKEVVAGKLAEMYSAEDFTHISAALSRLGLLPDGYPLREKYIELLGEQIAAFYDQHTHKLFMFEDASLETTQNRVVLAHELTHALQDQHFGLLKLPLEIKDNDDVALAASALVEGEATEVMTAYMMRGFSLRALKESASTALTQNTKQLAEAPRYLRELLLFPYLRGQEFCTVLSGEGGYEALSKCYARLPGSTSEILHPERYEAHWQPVAVSWPATRFRRPPGDHHQCHGRRGPPGSTLAGTGRHRRRDARCKVEGRPLPALRSARCTGLEDGVELARGCRGVPRRGKKNAGESLRNQTRLARIRLRITRPRYRRTGRLAVHGALKPPPCRIRPLTGAEQSGSSVPPLNDGQSGSEPQASKVAAASRRSTNAQGRNASSILLRHR